jgi:CheY-like chemotaxis protein
MQTERPLDGIKVLFAEDDRDTREMLCQYLQQKGARILGASAALQVLAAVDTWQPHIVISDLSMPGLDGYELVRRLRARDARIPAVAVTAHTSPDDRKRTHEAGFQEHLGKPIDLEQLISVIRRLTSPAVAR